MAQPGTRLAIPTSQLQALAKTPAMPLLRDARRQVLKDAESYAASPVFDWPPDTHNAHLIRARINQTRILTLLLAYFATGQARFKLAALAHVREMARWEYWSWITWRKNDPRPDAIFDLSYGENAMTLALAYDWLRDELTGPQRRLIIDQARDRVFKSFLRNAAKAWWFRRADSNWNTVCAGGAGMLALAVHDELPAARRVVALAERSIVPFMTHLAATGGGWPEGIGYWNYGMRYAFWYLLSHERATGRAHPLIEQPATRLSLRFPLDFTPHGLPCSFSDSNSWQPLPFHYAAAMRLDCPDIAAELDRRMQDATARGDCPLFRQFGKGDCPPRPGTPTKGTVPISEKRPGNGDSPLSRGNGDSPWPDWSRNPQAELLVMHPDASPTTEASASRSATGKLACNVATLYPGIDWAVLADRNDEPNLYLSLRGGSTADPHAQRDVLSFHCVAGREAMISSLNATEYLDTTFSPRRDELYDVSPASKNAIFINGVGVVADSRVSTTRLELGGDIRGFRLDATEAMGTMRDGPAAKFCGRAVLMLRDKAFLIIDAVRMAHVGRVESRMHSFARVTFSQDHAELLGKAGGRMHVVYAANVPAGLYRATALHTTPRPDPATVLRWCTHKLHQDVIMATLLCPARSARQSLRLALTATPDCLCVRVMAADWSARVRLTGTLTKGSNE